MVTIPAELGRHLLKDPTLPSPELCTHTSICAAAAATLSACKPDGLANVPFVQAGVINFI